MKTLFCFYEYSGFIISIQNHIIAALEELAIEIKVCHISGLKEATSSFQPVMTIHFHPNRLVYQYLDEIRELGGHKLLWDMESPYESDIIFDVASEFQHIFCSDVNTTKELQKT